MSDTAQSAPGPFSIFTIFGVFAACRVLPDPQPDPQPDPEPDPEPGH